MERIVVVGGGIVGTALGAQLSENFDEVTLFEKESLGAGTTGKSIANFAWHLNTRPDWSEVVRSLTERSWSTYEAMLETELSFHQIGWIGIEDDERTLRERKDRIDRIENPRIRAEILAPAELSAFHLDPEAVGAGGLYFPTEGRLDPSEIVTAFGNRTRANGGEIRQATEVTDVVVEDGGVIGVETSKGAVDADVVVNAAGPWAPVLNRMVGVSVPLRHTEAPIVVMDTEENFKLPSVNLTNGVYFTGEVSAKTLGGHYPLDHWAAGSERSPDTDQGVGRGTLSEDVRGKIVDTAFRVVPKLRDAEFTNEWQGIRCVTPDGMPVVGQTTVDGFYLATGMSGEGITLGPACAEYLAEALRTKRSNSVLDALSPDRFDS
jgi:sarcosine oxidase subunit beta